MILLDSSYLVALHNEHDVHHARALEILERLLGDEWGPAILPEYVLLEVTTVLRMRMGLDAALTLGETLLRSREVEFLAASEGFARAWDTFRSEREAPFSFVDAAIAAIARAHPPGNVATFDEDFRGLAGVTVVS